MNRMICAWAVLAALGAGQAVPQWWTGGFEAAFAEAKRRNVPILVGFVMDNEEANDRLVSTLYKDPEFVKLTATCVAMVAAREVHPPLPGAKTVTCSRFLGMPCSVHRSIEEAARAHIFGTKTVQTPYHVVLLPDGTSAGAVEDVQPTPAYVDVVRLAQKQLGPSMTAEQFKVADGALRRAKAALDAAEIADAVSALAEVDKIAKGTPFGKEAATTMEAVLAKGRAAIDDAKKLDAGGDTAAALRSLAALRADYKGTPVADEARKADLALRKTKAGQAAAAQLAKEERAAPILDKAREAEAKKDFPKAAREYARAVGIAPGSPLAAAARARLEAFRADVDVAKLVADALSNFDADEALRAIDGLPKADRAAITAALKAIVETWPQSPAAEKAKALLEKGG